MIGAIALLLGCELAGEVLRAMARLPVPGPVIGMLLLTLLLLARPARGGRTTADRAAGSALGRVSDALISNMGLLFVPAGVGVVAQTHLIRAQWLPILAGLLGSTVLGLVVTALVMRWTLPTMKTAACAPQAEAER